MQDPVFGVVDILIQVDYFGVNFVDAQCRSGHFKFTSALPAILGGESAGTIVALPTDRDVLNNETFKKQGYAIGGKVAVVRPSLLYILHI